jgi:hypothetical protein
VRDAVAATRTEAPVSDTSGFPAGQYGVHGARRAADGRCRGELVDDSNTVVVNRIEHGQGKASRQGHRSFSCRRGREGDPPTSSDRVEAESDCK